MGLEDLSRRDIKPGLIIYPQPEPFFKDTEYYKFTVIPPTIFPYVCLWVNDDESEWARITRKDSPNNIRVDKKGVLNPSNGFLEGDSFVSHDERFVVPIPNVMLACQSSKTPRPAFSPPVTKKIRESFGYEPKTEGTPLAMATVSPVSVQQKVKKTGTKRTRQLTVVYEKMIELHTVDKLNCKQIAARLNSSATEKSVRLYLISKGVYDKDVDIMKQPKGKSSPVLSPEDEKIAKMKREMAEMEAKMEELIQAKILKSKLKDQAEVELKSLVDKYKKDGLSIVFTVDWSE